VTGVSGYIGRRVLAALRTADCRVIGLSRQPTAGASVTGDVRDAAALRALVADTDRVVHLAAYVHREAQSARDVDECMSVNVHGTARLIEAITASGHKQHVVFMSTVAVYGDAFRRATEEHPCRPVTPYGRSKAQAEEIVRSAVARGAITASILRPALVCGPGAPGNLARLAAAVERGLCPLIGDGDNTKSLVHVDDLAAVVRACILEPPRAATRTYNVAAEPPLTMRQIVEMLAAHTGRPLRLVRIPRALVSIVAAVARRAGSPGTRLARTLDVFAGSASVDTTRMRDDLPVTVRSAADSVRAGLSSEHAQIGARA
jgi:nucleoside-diphosphate-sugar epimerase